MAKATVTKLPSRATPDEQSRTKIIDMQYQIGNQRIRVLDAKLTLECVRIAMEQADSNPETDAANNAESALRIVIAHLSDIEEKLQAIEDGRAEVQS